MPKSPNVLPRRGGGISRKLLSLSLSLSLSVDDDDGMKYKFVLPFSFLSMLLGSGHSGIGGKKEERITGWKKKEKNALVSYLSSFFSRR